MKSIIDSLTIQQKEEILNFSVELRQTNSMFVMPLDILRSSSIWPESLKENYCVQGGPIDVIREYAQETLSKISANYSGVPIAEEYKKRIQEKLVELEEAAKPYRS